MSQTQMELVPEIAVEIKDLTALQAERITLQARLHTIQHKVKTVVASVKEIKTIEELNKPVAYCNDVKDFIKNVESSNISIIKAILHQKWKSFCGDTDALIDPAKKAMGEVAAAVTKRRAELMAKLKEKEQRLNEKLETKAFDQREQQAQLLIDQGKDRVAKAIVKKPLAFTPIKLEMPKIKGAVWKKSYTVQIEDIGLLLASITKKPTYHDLIDQERLIARLEILARDLGGNMGDFKGIKCFQTENPAIGGAR